MNNKSVSLIIGLIILMKIPLAHSITPVACEGISQKCTKDILFDKTIGGTVYSCYECKQALCKDGGTGGLAGTKTSSVCTEKPTGFVPINEDDLAYDAPTELAPEPDFPDPEEDPGSVIQPGNFTSELVIINAKDCTVNAEIKGSHSQLTSSVGVIKIESGSRDKLLFDNPVKTVTVRDHRKEKTVRDHRKGKGSVTYMSSTITLPPGEYKLAPFGRSFDKQGDFWVVYQPRGIKFTCIDGNTKKISFITNDIEH